jgi:hypothetical protein
MNTINFSTPNGFPLEADATLGFMQADYQTAINKLATYLTDEIPTILSGVEPFNLPNGDLHYSYGLVVIGGELMYFDGGAYQANCYIHETIVQKPNDDGTLINRYYTRKIKFGNGAGQFAFNTLTRIENMRSTTNALLSIAGLEENVILRGCNIANVDAQTVTIEAGIAVMGNRLYVVPQYSGSYPVFFNVRDNATGWTTSNIGLPATHIVFNPFTSQYYRDVLRRQTAATGELKQLVSLSNRFDNTGLGIWEHKGWAICNGQNGTINLGGKALFGYDASDTDFDFTTTTIGGAKEVTLDINNLPAHNHSADTQDSGTEPNLRSAPVKIAMQGGDVPFDILPPYRVVVFIQRI